MLCSLPLVRLGLAPQGIGLFERGKTAHFRYPQPQHGLHQTVLAGRAVQIDKRKIVPFCGGKQAVKA
jgi:hypothetical protein